MAPEALGIPLHATQLQIGAPGFEPMALRGGNPILLGLGDLRSGADWLKIGPLDGILEGLDQRYKFQLATGTEQSPERCHLTGYLHGSSRRRSR